MLSFRLFYNDHSVKVIFGKKILYTFSKNIRKEKEIKYFNIFKIFLLMSYVTFLSRISIE